MYRPIMHNNETNSPHNKSTPRNIENYIFLNHTYSIHINNIIMDHFICPISQQIFYDPVVASDGHTYERFELKKWQKNNNTSPLTRETLMQNTYENLLIKRLVNEYLNENPNEKIKQYIPTSAYHLNKDEIIFAIKHNHFDELLLYDNYDLKDMTFHEIGKICIFVTLLKNCKDTEILKYVINNAIDLECENNNKWRPIHFICKFSIPGMIKYIIDKNVCLECEDEFKWRPIHFICRYSTSEMIKYIIDKNVNLECEDNDKKRPIHFICLKSPFELIEYVISKKVNLNAKIGIYPGKYSEHGCIDLIKVNKKLTDTQKNKLIKIINVSNKKTSKS